MPRLSAILSQVHDLGEGDDAADSTSIDVDDGRRRKRTASRRKSAPVQHTIVSAHTGTGKTATFLMPVLHHMATTPAVAEIGEFGEGVMAGGESESPPNESEFVAPRALILCPTRELVEQMARHAEQLMSRIPDSRRPAVVPIFGGVSETRQRLDLDEQKKTGNSLLLIATPGRLLSLLRGGSNLRLRDLDCMVVDECDKMLSMGFAPDVLGVFGFTKRESGSLRPPVQNMLFSATLVPEVEDLCRCVALRCCGFCFCFRIVFFSVTDVAFVSLFLVSFSALVVTGVLPPDTFCST
jgi:superfamily II DNA/RNA helicase